MKAVAMGYMVTLLVGLPQGQITPNHPQNDAALSSIRALSANAAVLRLTEQSPRETEAAEWLRVQFTMQGAEKPLAVVERLTETSQNPDLSKWAANMPDARVALEAIRTQPALEDYTHWLSSQVDDMQVAGDATEITGAVFQPPPPIPVRSYTRAPSPRKRASTGGNIPLYQKWLHKIENRPCPARAETYLPELRAVFAAEGLPEALVWLAETESSFNPRARNPVGARGLFQLMPETAQALGLSLRPHDQRLHPAKSARAAARYLKKLHARFGDWPLALAAYNGGETRVAQALKSRGAKDFAGIANQLPAETRLYVPKALATIEVRSGIAPGELDAPRWQ